MSMGTIFIVGERIDLCVPDESDFELWSSWFNDQKTTAFLEQGKYPQTRQMQADFFLEATANKRFLVLIKSKESELLGVISLSDINYEKSSCQISLVCPVVLKSAPLAALEAMALVTEHAFKRFGMDRVYAGQVFPDLNVWTHKLEVLGYKTEGFGRKEFHHGIKTCDSVKISVIKEDYMELENRRKGALWPGEKVVKNILKKYRKTPSLAIQFQQFMEDTYSQQDTVLRSIEEESEE